VTLPRWPSVADLRYAAARAVERSSLRKVAREIGMAPSWLDAFLHARQLDQRAQTMRRLRDWYVRESAALREIDAATAGAALSVLVAGLLEESERRNAWSDLVTRLKLAYLENGPLPDWLRDLDEPDED
jgi:hypothetical protein